MKLTQFATAAILVLLAVAGYLTIKSDMDARQDTQNTINAKLVANSDKLAEKIDELSKKQPAAPVSPPPAAPVPDATPAAAAASAAANAAKTVPAPPSSLSRTLAPGESLPPMAAADDPRMLEDERKILNLGANDRTAQESLNLPPALEGKALSPVQSQIVALPALAQVKLFSDKDGINFIVLNRGASAGMKPGDEYALRRKTAVIGRIKISDTIDANECVADLIPGIMPPGMVPVAGDDIIQYDPIPSRR